MISYFIAAHCTFMTNFSSELKSQFQIIFSQDSFPLNISSFQDSLLLQDSTNCLLANGWWNACFYHYSFSKNFSISFCKRLVCCMIFPFCQRVLAVFADYSFIITKSPIYFSYASCRWFLLSTSSMISSLIFLNKSFL